jgi:hypothetical protein
MPKMKPKTEEKTQKRCLIVFDGEGWFVRELNAIEHHLDDNSKSYHCAKPISGPWKSVGSAAKSASNWMKKP